MSSNGRHPVPNPAENHHVRRKYCENRPLYRRSHQLTAVRAYSVANESRHLLVFGVPQIELQREVRQVFGRIGPLEKVENVTAAWQQQHTGQDQEVDPLALEPFTDVFHVCFKKLEKARRAKKVLDAHNFYGGLLHISYAPERETVEEVRAKLAQRRSEVRYRTKIVRSKPKPKAKQESKPEPRPEARPVVTSVGVKQRRRSAIIAAASRMAAKRV
ncbi:RNA-binding protein 48 [Anopheles darlingi]|uniref:RNA-binding protein 48 n=1 Tax=Anopheles darlingi TaxID=43151 RepID=UPI002100557A|nr:RNA-binding protein 48 [Anopheles darlingi]